MKANAREGLTAFWFLLPFLIGILVFFAFAFLRTVYFSFTNYNLFQQNDFVGVKNFIDVPRDSLFLSALINTFSFAILTTVIQTIGALLLAIVMNQQLRGLGFFRTAYYFPSIASSAVTTLIFLWLFRPTGLISYISTTIANFLPLLGVMVLIAGIVQFVQFRIEKARRLPTTLFDPALLLVSIMVAIVGGFALNALGIVRIGNAQSVPLDWLSRSDKFLGFIPYPMLMIIIMNSFTTIPTLMLTFLAGLQGISKSMYEAAAIDGANSWQQTLYVTVPILRPVTFYVISVGIIGTLQMFDQAAILGGAAPLESVITLAYYVYNNVFRGGAEPQIGMASAAAIILAFITLGALQLQRRFFVSDKGA
ncbi:MAG: carbohydrate ABC transporter permease [Deinococcales bacterium]